MEQSRTKNATRNIVFGMFLKVYQILLPFIMRTAMIYVMGVEYLGLNSLFTSILLVLNLAELGVDSAMVFSMYKPIAENNKDEINKLLNLYKIYYRIIGAVIGVAGIAIMPLIPSLISKDSIIPPDVDLYVVYILNLISTVLSYWLFAYLSSLLYAHQRNDIISKVRLITFSFQYITQFAVILFTKSYYLYLIAAIVTQVLSNILIAVYSKRLYPYYKAEGKMEKVKVKEINGRIKDLFTSRLGMVVVTSADSIVISAFLGLTVLAIYNNYYYILSAVVGVLTVIFRSVTAGIGNSIATESKEKNYNDLKKFTFIIAWVVCVCSCCLLTLIQPFMYIWIGGDSSLMLDFSAVICFVLYFFVEQINQVLHTYKDASGIWHEDRFRPLVTAIANVVLNIVLIQFFGIYGVLFATFISTAFVGMPWIIHNLFTTLFKRGRKEYVFNILLYSVVTVIAGTVCVLVCNLIPDNGFLTLAIKLIITGVLSNIVLFIFLFKKKEFTDTKELVFRILKRRM
ncbi:MAG: polysaccharide biosynthesis protein [Ruminococcaceae bacterium]|nr:polysaccharide biosynthesis protein [Oscillospiraceae bacterium]